MTDGIIQQVIRRYLIPETEPDAIISVEQLQQELIEKIKQEINENNINGFDTYNMKFKGKSDIVLSKSEVLNKLIGDNQK